MQRHYLMGVYDHFSREKFAREHREWFTGVEASNLSALEDLHNLFSFACEEQMNVGVHWIPVIAGLESPFCSSHPGATITETGTGRPGGDHYEMGERLA